MKSFALLYRCTKLIVKIDFFFNIYLLAQTNTNSLVAIASVFLFYDVTAETKRKPTAETLSRNDLSELQNISIA